MPALLSARPLGRPGGVARELDWVWASAELSPLLHPEQSVAGRHVLLIQTEFQVSYRNLLWGPWESMARLRELTFRGCLGLALDWTLRQPWAPQQCADLPLFAQHLGKKLLGEDFYLPCPFRSWMVFRSWHQLYFQWFFNLCINNIFKHIESPPVGGIDWIPYLMPKLLPGACVKRTVLNCFPLLLCHAWEKQTLFP